MRTESNLKPRLIRLSDPAFLAECQRKEDLLKRQCFIRGRCLVLNARYPYEIGLDRIDTKEKALEWVHHLCEKDWITPQLIRRVLDLAAKHHGWKIYVGA